MLERLKESAAQAAEGVKLRFSLGSHQEGEGGRAAREAEEARRREEGAGSVLAHMTKAPGATTPYGALRKPSMPRGSG